MSNTILIGQDFNQKYNGKKFIKLTNKLENHNGYQFQTGLNVDSIPFNPSGQCQPGGIYFCLSEKMLVWLNYALNQMVYARLVTIPDDAQIYIEGNKFKADKIILSERQEIGNLEEWKDVCYCLEAVRRNGFALEYVRKQTPEICLAAVKEGGLALQYVLQHTQEICLVAVKRNGYALRYVLEQTPEVCLAAVKHTSGVCSKTYLNA